MKTTAKQDLTIDTLIATHRELSVLDVVPYQVYGRAMGGVYLKIENEQQSKWYLYLILSDGSLKESLMSYDNIKYSRLHYFESEIV